MAIEMVDFPIQNGDFSIAMLVYQRVLCYNRDENHLAGTQAPALLSGGRSDTSALEDPEFLALTIRRGVIFFREGWEYREYIHLYSYN